MVIARPTTQVFFYALFVIFVVAIVSEYSNRNLFNRRIKPLNGSIQIEESFYINMDKSVERKNAFLSRYNGPFPINRFPGVDAGRSNGKLGRGYYGCNLAHIGLLNEISSKKLGWYLVCEDDGSGDFSSIASNSYVNAIVKTTDKKFINLSAVDKDFTHRRYFENIDHSLSRAFWLTTCYLVHSSFAKELSDLILQYTHTHNFALDGTIDRFLSEPRFPFYRGNGKGAYVSIIYSVGNDKSDTRKFNRLPDNQTTAQP